MTLYLTPSEHLANPPETWTVIETTGRGQHRLFQVIDRRGKSLGTPHQTRSAAERSIDFGPLQCQWERERLTHEGVSEEVARILVG